MYKRHPASKAYDYAVQHGASVYKAARAAAEVYKDDPCDDWSALL